MSSRAGEFYKIYGLVRYRQSDLFVSFISGTPLVLFFIRAKKKGTGLLWSFSDISLLTDTNIAVREYRGWKRSYSLSDIVAAFRLDSCIRMKIIHYAKVLTSWIFPEFYSNTTAVLISFDTRLGKESKIGIWINTISFLDRPSETMPQIFYRRMKYKGTSRTTAF